MNCVSALSVDEGSLTHLTTALSVLQWMIDCEVEDERTAKRATETLILNPSAHGDGTDLTN